MRGWLGILVAVGACTASEGPSLPNGATKASLTTYWRSSDSTGCIVRNGGNCWGPLNFALASDGTAVWSANYGCCGTTTWAKVGGSTILISDPPFDPPSLNISNIIVNDGIFYGDASGYQDIQFTLLAGAVPNQCASSTLSPNGGACVQ